MNQELALSIGSNIKETRKTKSISQEQLALLTTIDRSYLGRNWKGKSVLLLKNSIKFHKHSMLTLKYYSRDHIFWEDEALVDGLPSNWFLTLPLQ